MRIVATALALALLSGPVAAQQAPAQKSPRLELFERSASYCKSMTLANAELSENLFRARSGTLTETCECASMLAVAQLSDETVNEVLAGAVQSYAAGLPAVIGRCVQAGGMR